MKPISDKTEGSFLDFRTGVLVLAAILFVLVFFLPPPEGLDRAAQTTLAIFMVCVVLWVTQAVPLVVTSLLALTLIALFQVIPPETPGQSSSEVAFALFANQAVFFILGALILASALMRSGLSVRIAMVVLRFFGRSPKFLLFGVVALPALLSCFMSEHAVAAMMFPVVTAIAGSLNLHPGSSRFGKALFLGMAYGCVVGGCLTFLGGARAPLAVEILRKFSGGKDEIGFFEWMTATLPIVLGLIPVTYGVLLWCFPPELKSVNSAREVLEKRLCDLGPVRLKEIGVGVVAIATIFAWVLAGQHYGLAEIAFVATFVLFALRLVTWSEVEEDVNWGIFLMYGGAIALGLAMKRTGAAGWLVTQGLSGMTDHPWLLISSFAALSIFLSNAMSNSAVVALALPIGLEMAEMAGLSAKVMTLAVTIPSGLAFMLPMGTPPVAIAFASGYLRMRDSVRAGLILVIVSLILFALTAFLWWPSIGYESLNYRAIR